MTLIHSTDSPDGNCNEPFIEAQYRWDLVALYTDLATAKGRGLTRVEKTYLRGLLCGYSPQEIAEKLQVKSDSTRSTLSKGLYRYLEALLICAGSAQTRVDSWGQVARLLRQQGYARTIASQTPEIELAAPISVSSQPQQYFDGLPDLPDLYGRELDLEVLKSWILTDRTRLVLLLGTGGIGKTALAVHLLQAVQKQFDYVVWRSVRNRSSPDSFWAGLGQFMSAQIGERLDSKDKLTALLQFMQQSRCLIVLEDIQAIFSNRSLPGIYAEGYDAYGELLRRVGEEAHQSCLVITSWEKPREVARLEAPKGLVRSYQLKGLPTEAARQLLSQQHLADPEAWDELIRPYRGNPLALKIVATTIRDLFAGSVNEFLDQNTLFLGDFAHLLHQQLTRLSDFETIVIKHLTAVPNPVSLSQLKETIPMGQSWSMWLSAIESLNRRSLLESTKHNQETRVALQPVIMKYLAQGESYA